MRSTGEKMLIKSYRALRRPRVGQRETREREMKSKFVKKQKREDPSLE
jgi:hypothetical protein